jgi:cytochrome c biogenesis protein CcdA
VDSSVFLGGSVVAATVAGIIALFAPCCISVMLPAYFAGSFQNRRVLTAMTFLFAAGIATVILPIALGASPCVNSSSPSTRRSTSRAARSCSRSAPTRCSVAS